MPRRRGEGCDVNSALYAESAGDQDDMTFRVLRDLARRIMKSRETWCVVN